ncbi:hypothetical protein IQ238_02570 [Pleurocapsales cyanobacterium LEGE 06147]|nr:hypothetical protein [Pleurocapsales cyanobacterium LEGE 06147]
MDNQGATLNISQQIVPPFIRTNRIKVSPIGIKVKSFKIEQTNNSQTNISRVKPSVRTVSLPSFVTSKTSVPVNSPILPLTSPPSFEKQAFSRREKTILSEQYLSPQVKRTWWQWFFWGAIAALLFQSSSEARNLLERTKIYLKLGSSLTTAVPESGKVYLYSHQASGFNQAIHQARKIDADSPFYQEAQADIVRWSRVIFDIAQGRANQNDFTGAIAAATLIPQDEPSTSIIAQEAAEAIGYWKIRAQRQQINHNLLEAAKKVIEPTQASSYNQGIMMLRKVAPGAANYREAQELIRQWSRQIYLIANTRAARGDFQQAVQALALVPKDSPYYEKAMAAILEWKEQGHGQFLYSKDPGVSETILQGNNICKIE